MSTQTDTVRYELMVIVSPDIGENDINKRLDAIRKSIKDFGGEIFFEDIWGVRDMSYSIRKHDQGYYAVLDLNLDPTKVKDLERILRLEVEVLRHLMVKLPAIYQPKSMAEIEAAMKVVEDAEEKKEDKKPRMGYARRPDIRPEVKPVVTAAKPVEKIEKELPKEVKEEKKAEEAPKKTAKKKEESKQSLEDIDAKLDSILSNPDINF